MAGERSIDFDFRDVNRLIDDIRERGKDVRIAMQFASVVAMSSIVRNFKEQGRPKPWKPLSESTKEMRRKGSKSRHGDKILMDFGRLWQSFTPQSAYSDVQISLNQMRVGTKVKYAKYHQEGTPPYTIYPKNKKALFWLAAPHPVAVVDHPGLKARPFAMWQTQDIDIIQNGLLDYVLEGTRPK
tara:strand:+ start:647 stop:1198 length:552 start_codon:yes stop_codon:yes gene_type:complete